MADVVIRGIEIPKEPTNITIYPDGCWCDYTTNDQHGKFIVLSEGHGRLVDEDEIKTRMTRKMYACKHNSVDELTYAVCIDIVDNADTILKAEVKNDG